MTRISKGISAAFSFIQAHCSVTQFYFYRIQNDLKILTERLSRINDSLARKAPLHLNNLWKSDHTLIDSHPSYYICAEDVNGLDAWMSVCDVCGKVAARNEYDQTIQETEAAYLKVTEENSFVYVGVGVNLLALCSIHWFNRWLADPGIFPDSAACTETRKCKHEQEEAGIFVSNTILNHTLYTKDCMGWIHLPWVNYGYTRLYIS